MLTSGQLIADRYRLARRIAVGGMGEVWEASDTRLDRMVAVKVLKAELSGDAEFLHRFRTEARTTAALNHPGIAAVHDYGETAAIPDGPQDTAYLVMELVEGEPLAAIIAREGRINPERTLDILEQAGHALQAAHERGLVHRDVKPGNIMVSASTPAKPTVKLTDFGIAKAADAAPVTRSGMVMGTAHYIAPEQALGQDAEPASDVYSLAVCGYECLAGQRPFVSENAVTVAMMHIRDAPPPLPPDVPPPARAVIEATLVKAPRQRYGTGGEFAAAIAAVRAGYPLPVPSGAQPPPPPAPVQTIQGPAAQGPVNQSPINQGPVNQGPTPSGNFHTGPLYPGAALHPTSTPLPPSAPHRRKVGWWVALATGALILIALGVFALVQAASSAGNAGTRDPDSASIPGSRERSPKPDETTVTSDLMPIPKHEPTGEGAAVGEATGNPPQRSRPPRVITVSPGEYTPAAWNAGHDRLPGDGATGVVDENTVRGRA